MRIFIFQKSRTGAYLLLKHPSAHYFYRKTNMNFIQYMFQLSKTYLYLTNLKYSYRDRNFAEPDPHQSHAHWNARDQTMVKNPDHQGFCMHHLFILFVIMILETKTSERNSSMVIGSDVSKLMVFALLYVNIRQPIWLSSCATLTEISYRQIHSYFIIHQLLS